MTEELQSGIRERLSGASVLLTGASGFLGKAVLATCLREIPEIAQLCLLLRAGDDDRAQSRLRGEVLRSRAFEGCDPEEIQRALESGRLRAYAADLTSEGLGRDDLSALGGIDVAIHCAASVSFQQPLDELLEINVHGTLNLVNALTQAGSSPHFVHVSTAYAAGARTGLVLERPWGDSPGDFAVDAAAELDAARQRRSQVEVESRMPEQQRRFVAEARREIGPAGGIAVGARAERARAAWIATTLVEHARERARALGWTDAYALSKALGERALVAAVPHTLTIVRPSIIESSLRSPFPGWIEGLKVADPVILAYASGLMNRFPANRSARLDMIPVDLVANACVAAAAFPQPQGVSVIALVSGSRNPAIIDTVSRAVTDYFRERPLAGADGMPVAVPEWKFITHAQALRALDRGERSIKTARRLLDRVPIPRVDDAERRLHREQRRIERLRVLADIYGPYTELDCTFDDANARALLAVLTDEERESFDFDCDAIDWETYLTRIHLPALRALVTRPQRPPRTRTEVTRPLAAGPPGLAIFDVEGVVLDATVVHFYAWLRASGMPAPDRALWLASFAARVPGFVVSDRRSRAQFNRAFYRQYRGLPAAELRQQALAGLSDFLLPRVRHDAVRRIRAHRARGDRVVLITGALDLLVDPLRHLADELVSARLLERRGVFTGELAEAPLTADGRASLAARLAAQHGVELADCYAYADSVSDLPLLEHVGHPVAVNPDFRLTREARRRGWQVVTWPTEPGAKTRPATPRSVIA